MHWLWSVKKVLIFDILPSCLVLVCVYLILDLTNAYYIQFLLLSSTLNYNMAKTRVLNCLLWLTLLNLPIHLHRNQIKVVLTVIDKHWQYFTSIYMTLTLAKWTTCCKAQQLNSGKPIQQTGHWHQLGKMAKCGKSVYTAWSLPWSTHSLSLSLISTYINMQL